VGVLLSGGAVDVSAQSDGLLTKVHVRLGDRVERGSLIARLDDRAIRRDLAMAQATLQAALAKTGKARLEQQLAQSKVTRREGSPDLVSQEDLETAKHNLLAGKAQVEISQAEVAEHRARVRQLTERLAAAEIRASFAGNVALRYVEQGTTVRAGQPLVRLLSDHEYRVRFAVPPEASAAATVGRQFHFRVDGKGDGVPGSISHVAQEIDTAAQMVFVEGTLRVADNQREALRAGQVGRVVLDGAAPRGQ
jgi:RND family efflux transporter MFP subunit